MDRNIGKYIKQELGREFYQSYIPNPLPPRPALDMSQLYPHLEKATIALAKLNAIQNTLPNKELFIYMYVRKEALLSSQIEGTQSSFSDLMLFENKQKTHIALDDVEEVSNYVKALNYALKRLEGGFPISLRLLKETHAILLSGGRGSTKRPGEFRKSQNWIGGTRPGNAQFVPPPVDHMNDCLTNLEKFIHNQTSPSLIKAGLVHIQFETIHPFLDGNGRLGRLLISLILCAEKSLSAPVLYLSLYLKQHRHIYYDLLQEVRTQGNWETWLEFFLRGVAITSQQAIKTISTINELFEADSQKIRTLGRARFSCIKILEFMKKSPQVTVPFICQVLNMTQPTARTSLNHMMKLGILKETSGKKRDKIYIYDRYIQILEEGTEPL